MGENYKKNVLINIIGSTSYAFTSLIFLIIVTRINGTEDAGVFTFAFSFACLLITIGNYSTRTFQVTETSEKILDYDFIYHRIITCLMMLVFGIIYSMINNYDLQKFTIIIMLVIYKMVEAFSEVLYGIIQKKEELYKVGISMFLKAVLGVIVFMIIDICSENLSLSTLGLILVTALILIVYDYLNVKKYGIKITKFDFCKIKQLFKIGFNAFAFTFLTLYVINASRYVIDNSLDNHYQTIYGILIMPATVLLLVSQFVIQPFLNNIKKLLSEKKIKELKKLTLKLCSIILVIGIICTIAAWIIGIEVLEMIYAIELSEYRLDLIIIIIGSVLYGIVSILSSILTAMRETKVQLISYIITTVITVGVSIYLISEYKIIGATSTYLISMIVLLILYIYTYLRKTRKLKGI